MDRARDSKTRAVAPVDRRIIDAGPALSHASPEDAACRALAWRGGDDGAISQDLHAPEGGAAAAQRLDRPLCDVTGSCVRSHRGAVHGELQLEMPRRAPVTAARADGVEDRSTR